MASQDSIEPRLERQFHTEKLARTIQDCENIDLLKGIAMELLKLNEKQIAIANLAIMRAADAQISLLKKK